MEQNQDPNSTSSLFQLNLDEQNSYTLRSAASWAKVLGVVGVILGIFFMIIGILVQQALNHAEENFRFDREETGLNNQALAQIGLITYLIIGLIFIVSSVFAFMAGHKINEGLKSNNQASLNAGFAGVRNYFAFWAILLIIFLLLLLINILGSTIKQ
jgi:magnesium-transporting ATPase (P-type)